MSANDSTKLAYSFTTSINSLNVQLFKSIPDVHKLVHGDLHIKNLMKQNDEVVIVDMDTIGYGHQIFELSAIFLAYVAYNETDPDNAMNFMGISNETCHKIYYSILHGVFSEKSEIEIQEIAEKCAELPGKVTAQFAVETLDYLHKGGRCSGAAALVGHIFHVHPYLKVVNGKLIVYKKPRGPMKIAINEQLNELKSVLPNVDLDHVMITHAGLDKDLEEYCKTELAKLVPTEVIEVTRAGSVIASHCGYGTVGILYITK